MKKTIIFLIVIILVSAGFIIYKQYYKKEQSEINNNENEKDNEEEEKVDLDTKISYYKKDFLTRYLNYKNYNSNLSDEDIITRVNIGLDHSFYTEIKESSLLNKTTIMVNKYIKLPSTYVPDDLEEISLDCSIGGMKMVRVARIAFEAMCRAAKADGMKIRSMSAYRSYSNQNNLYNSYVRQDGVTLADTYSARPGHSEHQTGLTTDVDNGKIDYNKFATTKEFIWMSNNAHKYGFIVRYPDGKSNITGYKYESWHYRYLGVEIATFLKEHNLTYDEYYVRFIESA